MGKLWRWCVFAFSFAWYLLLELEATLRIIRRWLTLMMPARACALLRLVGLCHKFRTQELKTREEKGNAKAKAGSVWGYETRGLAVYEAVPYATAERFRTAKLHEDCSSAEFRRAFPTPVYHPYWLPRSIVNTTGRQWSPISGKSFLAFIEQPVWRGWVRHAVSRWRQPGAWGNEEQALQLTVFQPTGGEQARRNGSRSALPVIVWIHGGAFITLSSYMPLHRMDELARTSGCIVVSINYRKGILGFSDLSESGDGDANCGLTDCQCALQWVQRYIANFGGDPQRVTIMGESAGAMHCSTLLALPSAKALFKNVVLLSGSEKFTMRKSDVRTTLARFAVKFGLPEDADVATVAKRLRQATLGELMTAQLHVELDFTKDFRRFKGVRGQRLLFSPCVDGKVLTIHPHDAIKADPSLVAGRTVIHSTTAAEYNLFVSLAPKDPGFDIDDCRLPQRIIHLFGEDRCDKAAADKIIAVYKETEDAGTKGWTGKPTSWRAHNPHPRHGMWSEVCTDLFFRLPAEEMADMVTEGGGRSIVVRFAEPAAVPAKIRAGHAVDIHYWSGLRRVPPFFAGIWVSAERTRRFERVSDAMTELLADVACDRHVSAPEWKAHGVRGPITVFGDAAGDTLPEDAPTVSTFETCEDFSAGEDKRNAAWGKLRSFMVDRVREEIAAVHR